MYLGESIVCIIIIIKMIFFTYKMLISFSGTIKMEKNDHPFKKMIFGKNKNPQKDDSSDEDD